MTRSHRSPHGGAHPSGVARIAVDLLGGDGAPAVVVDGALRACSADPDLHLLLVGPQDVADGVISALPIADRERVSVVAVDDAVGMADAPLRNIRRSTSVRAAAEAVYTGRVDGMVSAGSSGAAVAASAHVLGRLRGVRRPGLAAQLPTEHGPVLLIDVGVTLDATMLELVQHAVLGTAYAAVALGIARPRVGLLSIGSEPGKGDRLRRAVSIALSDVPLPAGGRYVGLVEGFDVPRGGPADVIVTDGFTGNVLLKGLEAAMATARRLMQSTQQARDGSEAVAPSQRSAPECDPSGPDPRTPTSGDGAASARDQDASARDEAARIHDGAVHRHDAAAPPRGGAATAPVPEGDGAASRREETTPGLRDGHAREGGHDADVRRPAQHEAAAVLLGVAGDVVVCHGSATGADIADGIALAARLHRDHITPAVAGLADDLLAELSSAGGLTIRDALGERS
ncbi:hypothetical protein [Dactylosporangium sp. NPDC051541]|uniref:hypothetical protein n=1 Tax=Dactylosporangium sp. NPDC051541 TaxID=3363977 RepID=UPI003791125C